PKAIAKPSSRLALISHEVLSECDASSHRFWENSNWRVASPESAFQSRIGQNSWRGSSHASKSGAKTRAHSQSCRETRRRFHGFRTKCFWSAMRPRIALGRIQIAGKQGLKIRFNPHLDRNP